MGGSIYSLFWRSTFESSAVITFVMLLLTAMSLVSWSIIFLKTFLLVRARKRVAEDYKRFMEAPDLAGAMKAISGDPDSSIYQIGYHAVRELRRMEKSNLDPGAKAKLAVDNVRRSLRQGVSFELDKLSTLLAFLASCANLGPFMGLFGTVWGIMAAFNSIGMMKNASLAVVGPGIADALTTTVVGLVVAIPASVAFNSFQGLLTNIETTLVNFAGSFLNRIQRELSWSEGDED